MVYIDNLREKELVIAYYFCGNTHKEVTRHEVFDMWSNWFKRDFRVNNKPVFCIENNKLAYRNGTHNAITSGDCDKMIRYMNENIKTTNDKNE